MTSSDRFDSKFSWLLCLLSLFHNAITGCTFVAPAIYMSDWIEEFDVSKAEASAVGSILAATVSLFGKCCIQSSGME